ncbi:hypothetical protein C8J57DRAFT_1059900 [Mycena rebaudengoi]|nr:hypothetical protein C8J57DRAFT_1059900 [Mycena rebaudengoi]
MPLAYATIAAASNSRLRPTKAAPHAPLTQDERKKKQADREDRKNDIDEAVGEWFSQTMATAEALAARFDMKPRYFLDRFFQGGARMINHQEKINPYNAFKNAKAAEAREQGESKRVPQLHSDHIEEYRNLTDEQKVELVENFKNIKARAAVLQRATPRAKIQDVANIVRNIQLLLVGLGTRVGVEAFFCIVRNNTEYHMAPQWFFTSPELEKYMVLATRNKWDTSQVGTKIEAFAVAGCDTLSE